MVINYTILKVPLLHVNEHRHNVSSVSGGGGGGLNVILWTGYSMKVFCEWIENKLG